MKNVTAYAMVLTAPVVVITVILASLMSSCGSSGGGGGASSADPTEENEIGPESAKASPEETKEVNGIQALAIDELPRCSENNEKQLVYLTTDKNFYSCEAKGWQKISVVENHVTEVTNVTNESSVLWLDDVTGRSWYVRGLATSYQGCSEPNAPASVVKSTESPSLAQIQAALANGLFEGVNVKIYYAANAYIHSNAPTVLKSDFSAFLYAFNLCLIID
jgi:hypothetical protein